MNGESLYKISMNYWWMNTDPARWNVFKKLSPGEIEAWDAKDDNDHYKRHMKDIRPDDLGLCYQTGQSAGLVAEFIAVSSLRTAKNDEEIVDFRLTRFLNKLPWEAIADSQIISPQRLKVIRRNTLVSLNKDIYDRLVQLSDRLVPSVMAVNVSWNPDNWQQPHVDRRAGHSYVREHPGHESVNFDFNKSNIDTANHVYGYCQWSKFPTRFSDGGYVVFYTRDFNTNATYIVGIYGDVELLKPPRPFHHDKFENRTLQCNMKAAKSLSLLLPLRLDATKYSRGRMVGQIGFKYYGEELVLRVVRDEYELLQQTGHSPGESLTVLNHIYFRLTGKNLSSKEDAAIAQRDHDEQEELGRIESEVDLTRIREELRRVKATDSAQIEVKGKMYKRDNKTIAQLKILRRYKCQICDRSIVKRDGSLYVEAAHITPKRRTGSELPSNIMVLCPNHHKEFDLGKNEILERTDIFVRIMLNEHEYSIDLSV